MAREPRLPLGDEAWPETGAGFLVVAPICGAIQVIVSSRTLEGVITLIFGRTHRVTLMFHRQTQRKLQTQSYRPHPRIAGRAAELLREIVHFVTGSVVSLCHVVGYIENYK